MGGERKFVAPCTRACAVGVAGLFIETHQDLIMRPVMDPT